MIPLLPHRHHHQRSLVVKEQGHLQRSSACPQGLSGSRSLLTEGSCRLQKSKQEQTEGSCRLQKSKQEQAESKVLAYAFIAVRTEVSRAKMAPFQSLKKDIAKCLEEVMVLLSHDHESIPVKWLTQVLVGCVSGQEAIGCNLHKPGSCEHSKALR